MDWVNETPLTQMKENKMIYKVLYHKKLPPEEGYGNENAVAYVLEHHISHIINEKLGDIDIDDGLQIIMKESAPIGDLKRVKKIKSV